MGGDLGEAGGGEELDLGGEEAETEEPAGDEDDVLLAAPGKRDDMWVKASAEKYTRNAPNKYNPHKKRGKYKRHKSSYDKGGRKKQFKNQATGEYGNTNRSIWKGYSDGLRQLGKGITEVHSIEENKLFTIKDEISVLLEGLKSKRNQNEDEAQ